MQDPVREISGIIQSLCATPSPSVQQATIERYFTDDAGFDHPLCKIGAGRGSRKGIQGVYSWYKIMSPVIPPLTISSVALDSFNNRLYVDVTQTFTMWLTPWRSTRLRLLVVLSLVKRDGLWYIKQQEDFYQPEVILSVGMPGTYSLISGVKYVAGYMCGVGASVGNMLGWWVTAKSKPS